MMKHRWKVLSLALALCALLAATRMASASLAERRVQSDIDSIRRIESQGYIPLRENFAAALRGGEIKSVLLLGDSISDNNGAWNHIFGQSERAEAGCRLILTDGEEGSYYEDNPDAKGWSWFFRTYLLENTSVTVFHNNAIGGKSAKWFNACKEQAIPQDYDAIVVMLGTNDRWFCDTPEEFRKEYGELLAYAAERCQYLQVLAPIPAFPEEGGTQMNMDSRQIAETVMSLCGEMGYPACDLYHALPEYAARQGIPMEGIYFGGVHPSPAGHEELWRLIAWQLGLPAPENGDLESLDIMNAVSIGQNREDISQSTPLSAQTDGRDIFPRGVSLYYLFDSVFIEGAPDVGTVVTYRYDSVSGKQIFRARDVDYQAVRRTQGDGWGPWQILDFR